MPAEVAAKFKVGSSMRQDEPPPVKIQMCGRWCQSVRKFPKMPKILFEYDVAFIYCRLHGIKTRAVYRMLISKLRHTGWRHLQYPVWYKLNTTVLAERTALRATLDEVEQCVHRTVAGLGAFFISFNRVCRRLDGGNRGIFLRAHFQRYTRQTVIR